MMKYNVKVTPDAEKDLKAYLTYLYKNALGRGRGLPPSAEQLLT